jgi:hypothetical protein
MHEVTFHSQKLFFVPASPVFAANCNPKGIA